MKRPKLWLIVLGAIIVLLVAGVGGYWVGIRLQPVKVSKVFSPIPTSPIGKIDKVEINVPQPLRAQNESHSGTLSRSGVIQLTNLQRYDFGLPPLTENTQLDQSASRKLQDMFKKGYFDHVSPSGANIEYFIGSVGYRYIAIGENLALGNFADDQSLIQAWMNSPGHKANILNKKYTDIGVAVGKGMYEGKETWMAVQHFGFPTSSCPSPDQNLKVKIDSLKNQIVSLQQNLDSNKKELDQLTPSYGDTNYSGKVNLYNSLVDQYDSLINQIKALVTTYNTQIGTYNRCAEG